MNDAPDIEARAALLHAFIARESPPCPNCGHRLDDRVDRRCPRCRLELRLALDRRGSGGRWWLTGVVAAAVASGFFVFTAPLVLSDFLTGRGGLGFTRGPGMIAFAGGFLSTLPLLAGWILARRRIQRWRPSRILLAAAFTLLNGIGFIMALAGLA